MEHGKSKHRSYTTSICREEEAEIVAGYTT
jgi:hypothetical protein